MSGDGPLSPEQKAALDDASARLRSLLRPARLATVNAWTIGVFGALTILWGLLSGGTGMVVGAALLAVAWNETRGRDRLRALDPEGARILGWNQILLGVVIALYCLSAIVHARTSPDPSLRELEELVGFSSELVAQLTLLVYGGVLLGVALVQALLARYHFARGPMMEAFRRETPPWLVELLVAARKG